MTALVKALIVLVTTQLKFLAELILLQLVNSNDFVLVSIKARKFPWRPINVQNKHACISMG